MSAETALVNRKTSNGKGFKLWNRIKRERFVYLLILPGLLLFITYKYVPMLGIIIAFQDYSPFLGFLHSPWVGFKNFQEIFNDKEIIQVLWNTLYLSFMQIVFAFPLPIFLAIMLNEVRISLYKRIIQSVVYLPHFLSWVVVVGIASIFLKSDGIVNQVLQMVTGGEPIQFLTDVKWFMPLVVIEVIWKETGWGTIIFLAALAGVNPELYEAAVVDGAGRFRKIWHITLPAIRSVVVILLILRLGNVLDSGFEQLFLMLNPLNLEAGNVLDTYVYFNGIQDAGYSSATAVGVFKSVVGLVLVVVANRLAKKFGEEGLY